MLRIPREMEIYRQEYRGQRGDHRCGAFFIPSRGLCMIVSSDGGWDHVSVSLKDRCPVWDEMEWVKRKFFEDGDTVIQIHPPIADYVNACETCLHLWRPWDHEIPLPPKIFIA